MANKEKKNPDRLPFTLAVLVIVGVSALALGYYRYTLKKHGVEVPMPVLTADTCGVAGGTWNACGSLCRTLPTGSVCPAVCVQQCECKVDDDCPYGYACGQVVNGIGVCIMGTAAVDKK